MKIPSDLSEQALVLIRGLHRVAALKNTHTGCQPFNKRVLAHLRRDEDGAALVELAFVLPLFLLMMLGIFKFGMAISNQLTLTQAVGSSAQFLAQSRTTTTDPCLDTFTQLTNSALNLNSQSIGFTVTMNGVTPAMTGNSCSGKQTNLKQATPVTVKATYPCDLSVYGVNFAPSCTLSATVTEFEY
jgi:Flp pilus assembly protein TadG